jgi:hypothetical protein
MGKLSKVCSFYIDKAAHGKAVNVGYFKDCHFYVKEGFHG